MNENVKMTLTEKYLDCREALNSVTAQLEVYKKAFDMACDELSDFCCNKTMFKHKCDSNCLMHWEEYLLQKARVQQ